MDLEELSDRMEIRDLITRYTRAVDTGSFGDLDDVFTADGILDYSAVGGPASTLAEARPWVEKGLAGFERWQHTIGQVDITLDPVSKPDSAHATAYFVNPMVARAPDGIETLWEVGGYYHHDLVRTPDGWRSTRMVDDIVWQRGF